MSSIIKNIRKFLDYEGLEYEKTEKVTETLIFNKRYGLRNKDRDVYLVVKNPTVEEVRRLMGYGY